MSVTKNQDPVKYLDASGKQQTCEEYNTITSGTTGQLDGGWWVVRGKVTLDGIQFGSDGNPISGTANLIICDGAELSLNHIFCFGKLVIYAQSTGSDMGKITADKSASTYSSAIYSNDSITINGGSVVAKGGEVGAGLDGKYSVTINGGSITTEGKYGFLTNSGSVDVRGGTTTIKATDRVANPSTYMTWKSGITVLAGANEASAVDVTGSTAWVSEAKWARLTAPVRATSVELDHTQLTLEIDEQATIVATVKPDDVANKTATWTSSNEGVATVDDNGIVTAVSAGNATITATSVNNPEASAECAVTVKAKPTPPSPPAPEPTPSGKPMFRLYNPNSGEHFYTSNAAERDNVKNAGWTYEGVGWTAPKSGLPVYRLYNEFGGEHHYTTSKGEHDSLVAVGWKDEGIGWYSGGSKPLYRQYNPNAFANNHNYTTSKNERDTLLGLGWRDEGIAWYGL